MGNIYGSISYRYSWFRISNNLPYIGRMNIIVEFMGSPRLHNWTVQKNRMAQLSNYAGVDSSAGSINKQVL